MSDLSLAQQIAALDPETREKLLAGIDSDTLLYDWRFWGRPNQLLPEDDSWHLALLLAGRGYGKGLVLDTPIPTPTGWTTMGELKAGDEVFDEQGRVCRVLIAHDEYVPEKAYRLTFSDGTHLDACDLHQWVTWTHRDKKQYLRHAERDGHSRAGYPEDWASWAGATSYTDKHGHQIETRPYGSGIRITQDIVDTFTHRGERANHSIPLAGALQTPEADLAVDPWVLGMWLGDGSRSTGDFTCASSDSAWLAETLMASGCNVSRIRPDENRGWTVGTKGLKVQLREAGVVDEKHVPDVYLRASESQRLALLQGLMDSDGFCDKRGSVEFCNTNKGLALAVLELARSLSERPVLAVGRATLNGKDYGEKYRVTWRPSKHVPFRLPRKIARLSNLPTARVFVSRQRVITSFTEMREGELPVMRCITVDSPNSMYLAGEGMIPTHNTRAGCEWVREMAMSNPGSRGAIVARTTADARDTLVQGESGILAVHPPSERPEWEPSKRRLVWPNGSTAILYTADAPDQLRGPQQEWALADEVATWSYVPDASGLTAWDNLRVSTRLGKNPKIVAMTTPKRTPFLRELLELVEKDDGIILRRGSTMDNAGNLSQGYLDTILGLYEGTSLARQELYGEMLDNVEGTLWQDDLIDPMRVRELPSGLSIVVGVDPSVSENPRDECGIVVVGSTRERQMHKRHGFVIEDASVHGSPMLWARRVVAMANKYRAPVVAEVNQGGALVRSAIHGIDPSVRVVDVRAHVGKVLRAEPVVLAYEQRRVHHLGVLPDLESQMLGWVPESSKRSPDRIDALVHALSALLVKQPAGFSAGGVRSKSASGSVPIPPIRRR